MGLARPVREQMFCVNVKPGFPKKVPVAMRVFGADRAQVLANGKVTFRHDGSLVTGRQKLPSISNNVLSLV